MKSKYEVFELRECISVFQVRSNLILWTAINLIFNLIFVFGVFADVAEVNAIGVHEFVLFVSVIVPGFGLLFPGNIWACRKTPGDKPSDEGDTQAHGKSQGLESNMVP